MTPSPMPWIKLYTEMLDDPKIGRLSEVIRYRFIELLLLAGECDEDGWLVNGDTPLAIEDIAWRLRKDEATIQETMAQLQRVGLIDCQDDTWLIVKFAVRQERPQKVKREQWREAQQRHRNKRNDVIDESCITHTHREEERREEERREEERREEEGAKNAPSPASPSAIFSENISAEHLFEQVTGFTAIPGAHREEDLGKLQSILTKHKARAPAYLAPYWQEWLKRRYRKTNTGWLDWAIVGEIPSAKTDTSNDWKQGYSSA